MIKNFVNKLLILVILSIGGNVVNASDKELQVVKSREDFVIEKVNNFYVIDNNFNNSTIDSDKNSKDNSPKINKNDINNDQIIYNSETNSKNTINNNRINYEPDKMWFDYQALFDNAKNAILGNRNMLNIGETNFEKNEFVRHVVFGNNNEYYKNDLTMMSNGYLSAYTQALYNMLEYEKTGAYIVYGDNVPSDDLYDLIHLNYQYMLGIVASFHSDYWELRNLFRQEAGGFPDDYLKYSDINNLNYNKVMQYIFE